MLEIVFQDDELIAINKPHGLLVHRSKIANDATEFAIQILRDQINRKVYPVHRLDRKTSGVLLFALNPTVNSLMQQAFMEQKVTKRYFALVRGYTENEGVIDYPLINESGKIQEAITNFRTIEKVEVPIPFGKFSTSRYSLLDVCPRTGRMHQIRKHLAHLRHPIIGDRPHGCNKQNKLFLEKFQMNTMLLHAHRLAFIHPRTEKELVITAEYHAEFDRMLNELNFEFNPRIFH